jgi:molybdenum cofactor synthesis domain-containing protein
VGSELLSPFRSDTNALWLTGKLREIGVDVGAKVTVADDPALLESAFRGALSRAHIVISTGGLGPTEDDLTREAAAAAMGRGMKRDPEILDALRARFARFQRVMAPVNEKQADVIDGAVVLENPRGTAPGQRVDHEGRVLVLLPGPPSEMAPMFEEQVLPLLRERAEEPCCARACSGSPRWGRARSSRGSRPSTRPSRTRGPPSSAGRAGGAAPDRDRRHEGGTEALLEALASGSATS